MDSMPKAEPVKLDRAHARGQEVEKCYQGSTDPLSSSAFKETLQTLPNIKEKSSNSEAFASEDIGCSMESDASSNAVSGDSLVSDADSVAPFEEKNLKRSPSGGSIVTYDGAASKLPEEGVCERTGERKVVRRPRGSQTNSFYDDQEHSITTGLMMAESGGPAWTDDKHCFYLNSIEATFVQSLYGQDYHSVDMGGQEDQDCVESRPMYSAYGSYPHGYELFTSLQRGCYGHREYYRPQLLHNFVPPAPSVFLSPWVQHFNPKSHAPSYGVTPAAAACNDTFTSLPTAAVAEEACCCEGADVKEGVMESVPDLNEVPGAQTSHYRSQSQHYASASTPVRTDTGSQAKKRHLETSIDLAYRSKKYKSLAEIDLEMEQRFLQEQQLLQEQGYYPDWREDKRRVDDEGAARNTKFITSCKEPSECHATDISKFQDDVKKVMDPPHGPVTFLSGGRNCELGGFVVKKSVIDVGGCSTSPVSPSKISNDEVQPLRATDLPDKHQCDTADLPHEARTSHGEDLVVKGVDDEGHDTSPIYFPKSSQDENHAKQQPNLSLEEEQCEFLPRKSPRTSKTYTWGSIGTRRMHREYSVFQEPVVPSARVKDGRVDDLQNKALQDRKVFKS